jgi:MFS family permease
VGSPQDQEGRARLLAVFLSLGTALVTALTVIKAYPSLWVVCFPVVAAALYLIGTHDFGDIPDAWQAPFARLGLLGVFAVSLILSTRWPWEVTNFYFFSDSSDVTSQAIVSVIILSWALVWGVLDYLAISRKRTIEAVTGLAPVIAVLGFSLKPIAMALFNVYLLSVSILYIMSGFRANRLSQVNIGLVMLIALVGVRFFDSQLNFVVKGAVMIVLGIGFLAANTYFLRKGMNREQTA